jgi:hypothetical protein
VKTLSSMSNQEFGLWLLRWTIRWTLLAAALGSLSTILKILLEKDT